MEKKYLNLRVRRIWIAVLLPLVIICFAFVLPVREGNALLTLRNVPLSLKASGFYVAEVTDARINKNGIGMLIPFSADGLKKMPAPIPADIDGGLSSLETYLKRNLPAQKSLKPIIVKINKLNLTEAPLPNGGVDGKLDLAVSFELKTGEDLSVKLVNYKGGSHYTRYFTQPEAAEPVLRNALQNALGFFNTWLDQQKDGNPLLANRVKVIFSDYTEKTEGDTVYYNRARPLTWADFQDKPRDAKYAAAVLPGIGYDEHADVEKGVIRVRIRMKTYVPKSACWVRPTALSDENLNHEQRHFDIAKIVAERFKQRIMRESLPVLNYDGPINMEYLDALRENDRLQKQYDAETGHGLNTAIQQKWNDYIEGELKKIMGSGG